jgi:nucleoside-diphosphate-sugar epimerase
MARAAGIRRFVFSSSCSLYGAQPNDQLANETCPLYPQTAYARAKADAEQELSKMASESFSPTFLRNATVYGLSPRLRVDVVANNLLGSAIVHNEIRVLSDGTPWRPIIHVKDVCMAFATAIAAPLEAIHNQAFNIGSWDENYQVKDIAQIVSRATGARVSINTEASPDMRSYRVDFNKAKERLGFRAQQTLSGSLPEMIDGYTKNGFDKESLHGFLFNRLMYIKALQEMNLLTSDLFWS